MPACLNAFACIMRVYIFDLKRSDVFDSRQAIKEFSLYYSKG